jgi:hypothetical protein
VLEACRYMVRHGYCGTVGITWRIAMSGPVVCVFVHIDVFDIAWFRHGGKWRSAVVEIDSLEPRTQCSKGYSGWVTLRCLVDG